MNRIALLGLAWTVSAAAAVGLGFLGVSLVDASPTPASSAVTATGPTGGGNGTTATTGNGAGSTPAPALLTSGEYSTAGGLVYARCTEGVAQLISAPAVGWWSEASAASDQVEFRDGEQKIEVRVVCGPDGPVFSAEGPRSDDEDRPEPTSATSTDAPETEDSGGRGSGNSGGGGSGESGSGETESASQDSPDD